MFDSAPKLFNEYIVESFALAIHTEINSPSFFSMPVRVSLVNDEL